MLILTVTNPNEQERDFNKINKNFLDYSKV